MRFGSGLSNLKSIESVLKLVASKDHEGGATLVKYSTSPDLGELDVPMFSCFLAMGMVPRSDDYVMLCWRRTAFDWPSFTLMRCW